LGEIDVDAVVVDKHTLHFEIGLLTVLLIIELDKCILQTVTGTLIANHFT
jgi:hypothetical protein